MGYLALVGLDDRLDAFRPAPPGLEIESSNRETFEFDNLDPGLVWGANLVGRVVGLRLKLRYANWSCHVSLLV
jgi:hypothetical protein